MRAIPGVRAAALGNTVPGAGYWGDDVFTVKEHPPLKTGEDLPDALMRWADPGYFSALGIPLVSGRFFTSDERVARSYKVIVSRQLVRQYFPGDNPIGKHLHVPAHVHDGAPDDVDYEIVGVVGDTLYQVGKEPKATMYFPILEGPEQFDARGSHGVGSVAVLGAACKSRSRRSILNFRSRMCAP